jgi:hypothetical protein
MCKRSIVCSFVCAKPDRNGKSFCFYPAIRHPSITLHHPFSPGSLAFSLGEGTQRASGDS